MLAENEVTQRLMSEYGYDTKGAALIAEKLLNLQTSVASQFQEWWLTGTLNNLIVQDYSIKRLQSEHGMNTIAAFLTLDWLVREPEKARRSLRKGHDRIG